MTSPFARMTTAADPLAYVEAVAALGPTNDHERGLLAHLGLEAEMIGRIRGNRPDYHYSSLADFALRAGTLWQPCTDHGEPAAKPRYCFDNALELAELEGYLYVEGYAVNAVGWPVLHAWNAVPGERRAIDVTWTGREGTGVGLAYLGVSFPLETVRACRARETSVIDDWKNDWPVLREPWGAPRA